MLDLRYVSENIDDVRGALGRRGFSDTEALDRIAALAEERRAAIAEVETKRAERNEASQKMASLDKGSDEFTENRAALRSLGDRIKELDARQKEVVSELEELMLRLPNLPHASTPDGLTEADNVEVDVWGDKPEFDFEAKDHVDLGASLGIMDFEGAAKVSGARFVVLKGHGARLERALLSFMMDTHSDGHGYTEVWPPAIVNDTSMFGTGQLPKFKKEAFRLAKDDEWAEENDVQGHELYLAPTAEVPVTNLHRGDIVEAGGLPIAYTAYTACFRSEAGSYGKDTRGMIRNHQFDKVELVRFCEPDEGEAQHAALTAHARAILEKLGLHYRVVELCCGDIGFSAQKCFDLEVWLPAQGAYREISSCSWFGDFQARRMKIRYRPEPKAKPRLLHTINGSGLAIGRTLVAILEQYQRADGKITVPEVLVPYMGGVEVIGA